MDISVHCDVNIFEWLMKWLKKDEMPETEELELDSQCVIPILVSAAFLQMEPLQQECLLFCHLGMNEILRTSTNLSCLNDTVITRLAAMYTNTEVEAIRDRKDRVQSKLYCKLIQSLCEPEPESVRGHWRSFARIYRCQLCQQLVSPSVATEVPCVPSTMHLHCDGSVTYSHVRDPKWDIHVYMEELYNTLRSWRKIYWRLWGDAHFLFCGVCKRFFPAHQIAWCRYHPDSPQFFTVDSQRVPLPVGRYPCCGERAYRFQIMDKEEGCQFREHTPITDNIRDSAVFSMLNHFRHLIEMEPPKLVFPERLVKLVARAPVQGDTDIYDGRSEAGQQFWWEGFEVIPQRPKLGLLGAYGSVEKPDDETATAPTPVEDDYSASSESSYSTSDSSGTENKSEESSSKKNKKKILNTRGRKTGSARLWQYNLSARSNQDIQRTNEEGTLKQVTTLLGRRCMLLNSAASSTKVNIRGWPRHITPPGGIWVRLECEWRERNNLPQPKLRNIFTGKPRFKSSRYNHVQ